MYNDAGQGPSGQERPYYRDDRNHHLRDEPHTFRGQDEQRMSRGVMRREPREDGGRPQYEMLPRE